VVNCTILINIVPLAIKWRKEKKVLKQLESLASRLQLTATPAQMNGTLQRTNSSAKDQFDGDAEKCAAGMDNHGYLTSFYGSQNEFDASIFGLNPSQYIGPPISGNSLGKMRRNFGV
jgi:hypothetical protein